MVLDTAMREQAQLYGGRPFAERSRDIGYAVIVEGAAPAEVGRRYEVSKQRVSQIVTRYYQAFLTMNPTEGELAVLWLNHGFEMPNTLVKPLETFLAKSRRSKDPKKMQTAVAAIIKALETQSSKLE